jgi:hypothetical protein
MGLFAGPDIYGTDPRVRTKQVNGEARTILPAFE